MLNYIQDNENIKDSAINTMLKDATSALKIKNKKEQGGSFSAIINNLNSRTQKTQTNFVDKVAKSNTSSINRKLFDKSSVSESSKTAQADNNQKMANVADDTVKTSKKPSKKEQAVKNAQNKDLKDDTKNTAKIENNEKNDTSGNIISADMNEAKVSPDKKPDNTEVKIKDTQSNTQKLSDINDNSSVKPSPVFLNDEIQTVETAEVDIETEEAVVTASSAIMPDSENKQQTIKEDQSDKASLEIANIDNSDEIVIEADKTGDESNSAKNGDEDILKAFDTLKEASANIEKTDFSEVFDKNEEVKTDNTAVKSNDIGIKQDNEVKTPVFSFGKGEKTVASADYSSDFKKPEVENNVEMPKEENESILLSQNDNLTVEKTKDNDIKSTEKTENVKISTNDLNSNKPELKITDDSDIQTTVDVESNDFKLNSELIEYDDEVDIDKEFDGNKEVNLKDKIVLKADNKVVSSDDKIVLKSDNKVVSSDDKTVKQSDKKIVLNNGIKPETDNTTALKQNDDKTTVVFDNVSDDSGENKADDNTLALNVQNVKTNVQAEEKTTSKDEAVAQKTNETVFETQSQNTAETKSDNNQNFKQNENTSKLAENKVNFDNYKKTETTEIDFDSNDSDVLADAEITEDNIKETKLYAKVEQNSDTNNEASAEVEANLEKLAFEQEKLDEILVSMSKQTINTSALTVADEVAKIAINEDTSISSPVNINYDGAGENILLKNMQMLRPSESVLNQFRQKLENSDILSQLTEKFEQIKGMINQKFTMVLRPNDLGRLSIELANGLKGLVTNIVVQNEHVRDFIEKNINTLRSQLASAGVNVNQIQIKTAGTGESTTYSGNQEQTQSDSGKENFRQNENNNSNNQDQTNKQYKDSLLASLTNFDTGFADDFSNVLNKTLSYELN